MGEEGREFKPFCVQIHSDSVSADERGGGGGC